MDVTPSLPPYAHVTSEAVQCIAQASVRYDVPELLLHAIIVKENGRMGKCSKNKNGTYDCGLAQINTSWVPYFAKYGIKLEHLLGDTCTNLHASAYILRSNFNKKNSNWFNAVVAYNIGPNNWTTERYQVGYGYASDVVKQWWGFQNYVDASQGIVRQAVPAAGRTAPAPSKQHSKQARSLVFEAPGSGPEQF